MLLNESALGRKVVIIRDIDNPMIKIGDTGVIVSIFGTKPQSVGVDFGRDVDGHNCGGCCERRQGWYLFGECDYELVDNVEANENELCDYDSADFNAFMSLMGVK